MRPCNESPQNFVASNNHLTSLIASVGLEFGSGCSEHAWLRMSHGVGGRQPLEVCLGLEGPHARWLIHGPDEVMLAVGWRPWFFSTWASPEAVLKRAQS